MPILTLYGFGISGINEIIGEGDISINYPAGWDIETTESSYVDSDGNYIYSDIYKPLFEIFPLRLFYIPFDSINSTNQTEGIDLSSDDESWLYLIDEFSNMKDYLSIGNYVGKYNPQNKNNVIESQNFIEQYAKNLFDETFIIDEKLLYLQGILNSKQMPNGFSNFYERSDMEIANIFSLMRTELWQQASSLLSMIFAGYCNNNSVVGIDEYKNRFTFKIGKLCWEYNPATKKIAYINYAQQRENSTQYYYGDMVYTTAESQSNEWTSSAVITQGQIIFPTDFNNKYYMCTTGGTTGAIEPLWETITYPYTDGTAIFEEMPTLKYYKCIKAGITSVFEPSFHSTYTIGDTIADNTTIWECIDDHTLSHDYVWRTSELKGEKLNRIYDFTEIQINENGWYLFYLDNELGNINYYHETTATTLKDCFDNFVLLLRRNKVIPLVCVEFIDIGGGNYVVKQHINLQHQGRVSSNIPEVWNSSHYYYKGQIIYSKDYFNNPYYYQATNNGWSDSALPPFDIVVGNTTVDNGVTWKNIGMSLGINNNILLSNATKSRGGLIKCDNNSEKSDAIFEQIFKKVYALDINMFRSFYPKGSNNWIAENNYNIYNVLNVSDDYFYRCVQAGKSGKSTPPFVKPAKQWVTTTVYNYGDVVYHLSADGYYWVCLTSSVASIDFGFNTHTTNEECYLGSDGVLWKCLGDNPRLFYDNINFWSQSTKYKLGEVITPKTINLNSGVFFVCTQAGTSGTTEPVFETNFNYIDGTCKWEWVSNDFSGVDNSIYAQWMFINNGLLEYKHYENN